ncbi:hypothetical protein E2542_SST06909 [Spatholobus suberectus]|nr:hypothetical protein E2542_SST06909 [Spatholobus suberectus]
MRRSISLLVVLTVLAVTWPSPVNCRVLALQERATHEPVKDHLQFPRTSVWKEKGSTKDHHISTRVLVGSQVHAMSSGPSRRGSAKFTCSLGSIRFVSMADLAHSTLQERLAKQIGIRFFGQLMGPEVLEIKAIECAI